MKSLLLLLAFVVSSQAVCKDDWIPFFSDSSRCFKPFKDEVSYMQAETFCRALSSTGHLVTIENAFDNQQILNQAQMVDTQCKYWIGFNRIADEHTWTWLDGCGCTFTDWKPGMPLSTGADCAYIDASAKQSVWANDLDCSWAHCFLCEQ